VRWSSECVYVLSEIWAIWVKATADHGAQHLCTRGQSTAHRTLDLAAVMRKALRMDTKFLHACLCNYYVPGVAVRIQLGAGKVPSLFAPPVLFPAECTLLMEEMLTGAICSSNCDIVSN
jgi:hypothetical protein